MGRPIHFVTKKFKQYREERGWSQRDMADFLALKGVPLTQAEVAYYETGKRGATAEKALEISKALNIPVMELVETRNG